MSDIMFCQDLPRAQFGEIKEEPDEVVAGTDADEKDDDAPASQMLIDMLGFDPDKVDDEGNDIEETKDAKTKVAPDVLPETTSNTSGIMYKQNVIKQDDQGKFRIFSVGGALIAVVNTLEEAMNKINGISIEGEK